MRRRRRIIRGNETLDTRYFAIVVIVDTLILQITKAANDLKIHDIAIAGGVSANSGLRKKIVELGIENNWKTFIPRFEYCTDNAAMIAIAGKFMYENQLFANQSVTAEARISI